MTKLKRIFNIKLLSAFLLIFIGTVVTFTPPTDPDFGWHYKYGEYIFQHQKLLRENIFSFTNTDYKWVNSYWLSQIYLYFTHHLLGHITPTIINGAVLSIFTLYILKKHANDFFSISLVYLLMINMFREYSVTIRPLYFSTVFLITLIHLLLHEGKGRNFIPLIFLLWANFHADFLMGLFILGVYSLSKFFSMTQAPKLKIKEFLLPWKNWNYIRSYLSNFKTYLMDLFERKDSFGKFFICFRLLLSSVILTFINPNGVNLWFTLIKELTQPFKTFVAEWAPVGDMGITTILMSVLTSSGVVFSILPNVSNEDKNDSWYRFLVFFFYIIGIKSVYFLRVCGVISAFILLKKTSFLRNKLMESKINLTKYLPPFFSFLLLTTLLILSFTLFFNNVKIARDIKVWAVKNNYPYNAVEYIKENPIKGNMLNDYNWGGYLIWQLPESKTFIDGRMTAWKTNGVYVMEEYEKIMYRTQENKEKVNKYIDDLNITWIINNPKSTLVKYLRETQPDRWETVFEDEVAVILRDKNKTLSNQ